MTAIKVADNLAAVRDRIAAACLKAGRPENDVELVAVSKRISTELVVQACLAGQRDFGENRLPDGVDRQGEMGDALADAGIDPATLNWHFIGHIQSRKAVQAVGHFSLLHGVDSLKLARKISSFCDVGQQQDILLEVNVTGEEQKHGFSLAELPDAFGQMADISGLKINGLMCMARYGAHPSELHQTFAQLRLLAENIKTSCGWDYRHLSMGMSGDFEVAIEEGATLVRVGSAIFGPRG